MVLPADKNAPQKGTSVRGVGILLAYGHFKWSDFKMGSHESARFKVFLDQAVKDGKIKVGKWKKSTWIGFAVLSRLVSSYLSHNIKHGSLNWDIPIAKCLSLVLISALGARSGDVFRSMHYKGQEYLQWRHVRLHLVGSQPSLANVRATITLQYQKFHKIADNEETEYYLSPLGTTEHNHMCPIAWLLVHALRHSLVADETLQGVLDRAFARSDRRIEWLYPNRPVLAAFDQSPAYHVDLDRSATTHQPLETTKQMGVIAGMLDRAYAHALRFGHARDVAQLPTSVGNNTENARQSLGHNTSSLHGGVTDRYIGDMDAELHTLRAQHSLQPRGKVPRFATPSGEVESIAMTADKLKSGSTTITPLPKISRQRRPLADKDVNSSATLKAPKAAPAHPLQNVDPALLTEDELASIAADVPAPAAEELYGIVFPQSALDSNAEAGMASDNNNNMASDKNDPTLLSAFGDADAQAALRSLGDKSGAEEDEALFVTDGNPAPVYSTSETFIDTYLKVNEVATLHLARAWTSSDNDLIAQATEKYCQSGGSRDLPTPKIYKCNKTPGCQNSHYIREHLQRHELTCSPEQVERFETAASLADKTAEHACPHDGCDYKPPPGTDLTELLRLHIQRVHNWEPKPCEHGCDPEILYYTIASWNHHHKTVHTLGYPAKCIFPRCTSTATYGARHALERHLGSAHKLQGIDQMEPYLPAPAPKLEYVDNQPCWVGSCEVAPVNLKGMKAHLQSSKHGMTLDDAKASIEENADFDTVAGTHIVKKKRAITSKQIERQQERAQKKTKTDD